MKASTSGFIQGLSPLELSIGDYVLSGGETGGHGRSSDAVRPPAARGRWARRMGSARKKVFTDGCWEYPQYNPACVNMAGMSACRTCCWAATTGS